MRGWWKTAIGALVITSAACDRADTSHNARQVSLPNEEAPQSVMATVYSYTGTQKALEDMNGYVKAEKWSDALGAANALLKVEPQHAEAARIRDLARLEGNSKLRLDEFTKRAATRDVAGALRAYKQIAATSIYRQKAQPEYTRLRDVWLGATEAEVRGWVKNGRCDDARRAVRQTAEMFPEGLSAIETIADTCKARVVAASEPRERDKDRDRPDDKRSEEVASLAPTPAPAARPEPTPPVAEARVAAATPPRTAAVAAPKATAAVVPPAAPAPVAQPAPAPKRDTKPISSAELEKLRVAGSPRPEFPVNAKNIMRRDGVKSAMIALKLCVSDKGSVTSVQMVKGSDYDEANKKIIADVKAWRFKPYMLGGEPTPVCSAVILNYQISK